MLSTQMISIPSVAVSTYSSHRSHGFTLRRSLCVLPSLLDIITTAPNVFSSLPRKSQLQTDHNSLASPGYTIEWLFYPLLHVTLLLSRNLPYPPFMEATDASSSTPVITGSYTDLAAWKSASETCISLPTLDRGRDRAELNWKRSEGQFLSSTETDLKQSQRLQHC